MFSHYGLGVPSSFVRSNVPKPPEDEGKTLMVEEGKRRLQINLALAR